MGVFRYPKWQHRDGLTLLDPVTVWTKVATKTDGRGSTSNNRVAVGVARRGGYLVVAIPADVHHVILTPAQARTLGELLLAYGEAGQWPPTP